MFVKRGQTIDRLNLMVCSDDSNDGTGGDNGCDDGGGDEGAVGNNRLITCFGQCYNGRVKLAGNRPFSSVPSFCPINQPSS